jgi:transcriptional regulator with XRE-family HTH domain
MSFGQLLRIERDAMNWSREHLEHIIKVRCKNGEHTVSATTIKQIELGLVEAPRNGTRAILRRIFPKLPESD